MSKREEDDIIAEEIQEAILAEARKTYSPKVVELFLRPMNLGVVKDPNGFGVLRGIGGDTMKIYLKISREKVEEAKFITDGCGATVACGSAVTEMAKGKKLEEVLGISPRALLDELGGLPRTHLHCSILAVNTLQSALANYLLLNEGEAPPE